MALWTWNWMGQQRSEKQLDVARMTRQKKKTDFWKNPVGGGVSSSSSSSSPERSFCFTFAKAAVPLENMELGRMHGDTHTYTHTYTFWKKMKDSIEIKSNQQSPTRETKWKERERKRNDVMEDDVPVTSPSQKTRPVPPPLQGPSHHLSRKEDFLLLQSSQDHRTRNRRRQKLQQPSIRMTCSAASAAPRRLRARTWDGLAGWMITSPSSHLILSLIHSSTEHTVSLSFSLEGKFLIENRLEQTGQPGRRSERMGGGEDGMTVEWRNWDVQRRKSFLVSFFLYESLIFVHFMSR